MLRFAVFLSVACTLTTGAQEISPMRFGEVAQVLALESGGFLVLDSEHQQLVRLDANGKLVKAPLGAGAKGLQAFSAIASRGGDSAWVYDVSGGRAFPVSADFELGRPLEDARSSGAVFVIGASALRTHRDGAGATYAMEQNDTGMEPLVRTRRGITDTLAMLVRPVRPRISIGGRSSSARRAFAPIDAWGLSPSGEIVVVRGSPFVIEWLTAQGMHRSPEIAATEIPVTDADKAQWKERQLESLRRVGSMLGSANLEEMAKNLPEPAWSAVKPPFVDDRIIPTRIGAERVVWVQRPVAATQSGEVWAAFDADGRERAKRSLSAGQRVVGALGDALFVAERAGNGERVIRLG